VSGAVQLPLDGLPVDPIEVSKLLAHERGAVYRELGLHPLQIAAAEEAVRAVIAGSYRRRAR
jgi:hypothetical protein